MNYQIADHIAILLQQGDSNALTYYYKKYKNQLYFTSYNLIHDQEEARDIVSETFLKLWALHGRFNNHENIKAFLFITTTNSSLNFLRDRTNRQKIRTQIADSSTKDQTIENIEVIEQKNSLGIVFSTIRCLSPIYRQTLEYYYIDQLSIPEIANIMQTQEKNVRNNIDRARNRLKKYIQKKLSSLE